MARIELKVAKPCNQTWTAMKGDDQVRFCQSCQKNVYNIGQMSDEEVEALIRRTEGKFCARIYKRTDNRVMTADCPKGVAAARRKIAASVAATVSAFSLALYPMFKCGTDCGKVPTEVARARAAKMEAMTQADEASQDEPVMGKAVISSDHIDLTMGEVAVSKSKK